MKSLNELKELYTNDLNANSLALSEYKESLKYYHGNQLDPVDLATITSRGQAPIIENIYKMIINKILGYKAQSISEFVVSGRQQEDKNLAFLLNDLLSVFSHSDFYNKEMMKKDRELIFGLAVCEVWIKEDKDKNRFVELKSLATKSFLIDAYSKDLNAKDARRFHKALNMDYYEACELFNKELVVSIDNNADKRVKLVETWIKEKGVFNRYIWNDKGILLYEKSPFKDGSHPFCIAKFNIDENGLWYGLFRDIKPMQDYINFAENKMGNMLGSFKAMFEADAVLDAEEFIEAIGQDNAVVKVNPNALSMQKIQFVQHHADIQALSAKANEKRQLAKILSGLNDEFLGIANNRQSGEAIAQRREAGLMGLQEFLNRSDDLDRLIFEKALNLIQMYFTKKQIFKIVDKDKGLRYFSINDNENNQIKIGAFDLEYKTKLKISSNEDRFTQWSEIIKVLHTTQPELTRELLPLILQDIDSPIVEDVKALIAKINEQQAQMAQTPLAQLQQQNALLELENLKAEINEKRAKAGKYTAQGILAHKISEEDDNNKSMQKGGQDLR